MRNLLDELGRLAACCARSGVHISQVLNEVEWAYFALRQEEQAELMHSLAIDLPPDNTRIWGHQKT